jgi:hypothetical protein
VRRLAHSIGAVLVVAGPFTDNAFALDARAQDLWAFEQVPTCSLDEPVFEALLAQWRTPDAEVLAPLLLAACDRHTYQARYDSDSKCYDLSKGVWWYDPFEIHSVLRLRLRLGLSNPVLDHPLLSTPLGVLPPETPPYCDGLLAAVLAQGRREMPDLPTLDWPGAPQADPRGLQPAPTSKTNPWPDDADEKRGNDKCNDGPARTKRDGTDVLRLTALTGGNESGQE